MRPGRDTAVAVCLAAAVLAAAASLVPVVAGPGWLVELTATLLVLTAVSVVLGRLGAPGWAVAAVQVVVLVEVLTVVHAPAQAVAGLLPGPAAIAHAGALLEQAVAVVQGQSAPIDAVPGVRLGMTAAGGAVLVLAHALVLTLRRPALVGLPLVAVHGVGAVFAPGGLGAGPFLLAAAGWLLVVLVARAPAPRWGPVVAPAGPVAPRPGLTPLVVAGALVLALVVPAAVALPSSPTFFVGRGGGGGVTSVNPLLDLREDLTDRSDTVVMTYRIDRGVPQPLRVVTVDSFDGSLWRPAERSGTQPLATGTALEAAPGLDPGTQVEQRSLAVRIETLRQEYLPLPYPVSRVDVDGRWEEDRATATVTGTGSTRTRPGLEYSVDYQQVSPDPAVLAAAPPAPPDVLASYGAGSVPADLPPVIAQTAQQVVDEAEATTDYARGVALQDWFRESGLFDYSTTLPAPTSPSALADFLADRQGYCVHFASAMAVMARTLGIPARVAVGFLPGTRSSGVYQVRASDAHAWPELYFQGAGWTRFEPTPSRGEVPAWTVPATSAGAQEPVRGQQPSTAPQPLPQDVPAPGQRPDAGAGSDGSVTQGAVTAGTVLAVVGGVAAVLLLLALPALARRRRSVRRWRRALGRSGAGARPATAEAAWADLVERLEDLGVGPAPSATPRQVRAVLLDRLGSAAPAGTAAAEPAGSTASGGHPGVAASLVDLVGAVERSRYGSAGAARSPGGIDELGLRGEALQVERAVRATVGRRRVLLARWWPSSGRRALLDAPSRWLDRTRGTGAGREVEQAEDALR